MSKSNMFGNSSRTSLTEGCSVTIHRRRFEAVSRINIFTESRFFVPFFASFAKASLCRWKVLSSKSFPGVTEDACTLFFFFSFTLGLLKVIPVFFEHFLLRMFLKRISRAFDQESCM